MNLSLGIVVPCYNEEEILSETTRRLEPIIDHTIEDELITEGFVYIS